MAGLFYLPRLYVYHAGNQDKPQMTALFSKMEARLLKIIMGPALLLTWATGISLALATEAYGELWFWCKFGLVLGLSLFHAYLGRVHKSLAAHTNQRTERYFRIINELPTLFLVFILFLVLFKPFA